LAGQEAQTVSNLYRDNIMNAINGLAGFSQANTSGGLNATNGISNAGQAFGQIGAQQLQGWTNGLGGIAGALGTYFGMR
jgi:hypothetical protein